MTLPHGYHPELAGNRGKGTGTLPESTGIRLDLPGVRARPLLMGYTPVKLTIRDGDIMSELSETNLITAGVSVLPRPGISHTPTDPDRDGLCEDLNATNRLDFNDVVLMFNQKQWIAANEPVSAFDFTGNKRIDFNGIVKRCGET